MRQATRYTSRREYRTEPSEASDVIVAVFRFAIIIAFTLSTLVGSTYAIGWAAAAACVVAAVYTLFLVLGYLLDRRWMTRRRRWELASHSLLGPLLRRRVTIQRVTAIVIDLALLTAIIDDIGTFGDLYMNFYFVPIGVAAIWFHREGGMIVALAAILCVTILIVLPDIEDVDRFILQRELPARAAMFLAMGLVIGYLARARDAERLHRERIDWELDLARQVQTSLLPDRLPTPPGYELGVRFVPANVVGGDYYDAIVGPDGRLFIAVADVAGKSVYGVMHLSLLRSALREAVLEGLSPLANAERLNETLVEILTPNTFISLFCAAIELSSGKISFVNCGHTPPVMVGARENGEPRPLFTGNIVLGVEVGPTYVEAEETIGPGECLICCTDGVTEAMNAEWESFNTEGVMRAAQEVVEGSADEIADAVLKASQQHGVAPAADDATILVVRRTAADTGDSESA